MPLTLQSRKNYAGVVHSR